MAPPKRPTAESSPSPTAPPPGRVGRPTSLTPAVMEKITEGIAVGLPTRVACARAGISKSVYYHWLNLAEQGDERYSSFLTAVQEAVAERHYRLSLKFDEHMEKHGGWLPIAWARERDRHFGDEWPRPSGRIEHTGEGGGPITVRWLTPEEAEAQQLAAVGQQANERALLRGENTTSVVEAEYTSLERE